MTIEWLVGRNKRVVDGGGGAPPKILEVCMGEATLPTTPRSIFGNFLQVVVVLF